MTTENQLLREALEEAMRILDRVEFAMVIEDRIVGADLIRLRHLARAALTQRPAAQTEGEAPYGYCPECGAPGVMRERRPNGDDSCSNGHRYPSRTARASLPAPQQATPATPEDMKVYGGIAAGYFADTQQTTPSSADRTLADYFLNPSLSTVLSFDEDEAQQATPEPVGEVEDDEVFLPRRLAATQKLKQLGYRYNVGQGQWLPDTRPARVETEPVGEPAAYREKLTGRLCEPDDTHRRKFPMCYEPLFTRPAPGVPEGFALVPAEPTQEMLDALNSSVSLPNCYRAMLAAQAKGEKA